MEEGGRRDTLGESRPGAPKGFSAYFWTSMILGGILTLLFVLVEGFTFLFPTIVSGVVHLILQVVLAVGIGAAGFSVYYYHRRLRGTLESHFNDELAGLRRQLEVGAITDGLTGLYNYRYFYSRLSQELLRAQRYGHPLSVLLVDLDNFVDVNRRYGRLVGDGVLRRFAILILRRTIRATDLVARYGGDEFVAILTETDRQGAIRASERLREVAQKGTILTSGQRLSLPISIGIASYPADANARDDLIRVADQALQLAKGSQLGIAWPGRVGPVSGGASLSP